ncbi:MAG TPA: alpha/beta hydrolase [Pirellulaceae bacterium]|jgi:acetyl esterase/lipase
MSTANVREFLLVSLAFVVAQSTAWGQAPLPQKSAVDVEIQRDIEYAKVGEISLKLDFYRPETGSDHPRPCVVWIHGGGWRSGSKSGGGVRLSSLVSTGEYVAASIDYRLLDVAIWPAQIYDCKAAIRYLRANSKSLGIDPDKIGVWGASAGGHLASLLGTSGDVKEIEGDVGTTGVSSRVACVVDFCGPSDFRLPGIGAPRASDQISNTFFGGPLKDKEEAARQASPVAHVTADDPPFLIMHGTQDNTVNIRQAERLYDAQKQAGASTIFVKIEGGGHGFGGSEVNSRVKAFLDKHLHGKDVAISDAPIEAAPTGSKPTE